MLHACQIQYFSFQCNDFCENPDEVEFHLVNFEMIEKCVWPHEDSMPLKMIYLTEEKYNAFY